jgi:hypothetical protein
VRVGVERDAGRLVAERALDRHDVAAVRDQARGEVVPEGVDGDALDASSSRCAQPPTVDRRRGDMSSRCSRASAGQLSIALANEAVSCLL